MEWTECFNCAVSYIEEHLTEKIDPVQLARIAGCSSYYFQKTFLYVAGLSVSEYIRRRRMTLAAAELRTTQKKIVDIALKYGYDSPTAFNRAFQSVQGVPPSAVRQNNAALKVYPVLTFHFSLSGADGTAFKIEKKPSFQISGVSFPLDKKLENNFAAIPGQWDKALADGTLSRLCALMEGEPRGLLGVSVH
ncbi:MAG: AraC family transcriptional regulator, partial [Oscillospiraceae bacterium]|nr:AraC family transcriptional regulator [Oscillospiraceae bacterium]